MLIKFQSHFLRRSFFYYLLSLIFIVRLTWNLITKEAYQHNLQSPQYESFKTIFRHLFEFRLTIPERFNEIIKIYWRGLFNVEVFGGYFSVSFVLFLLIIITLFFFIAYKVWSPKLALNIKLIAIFVIVYLIGHFITYLFIFSDGESRTLSSFSRYLLPLTAGFYLVIVNFAMEHHKRKKTILIILVSIISFPFVNFIYSYEHNKGFVNTNLFSNILVYLENANPSLFNGSLRKPNIKSLNYPPFTLIHKNLSSINSLCFLEGKEGSSYGYNLASNYYFSPVKFSRIITYKTLDKSQLTEHIIKHSNNCDKILVIDPDSNLVLKAEDFFSHSIVNFGLYEIKKNENKISFHFIGKDEISK